MIEKKEMFMVWTLEIGAAIDVIALVDVDEKEVLAYQSEVGENYRSPRRCERFFDTRQEANEYIQSRINALNADKKKVTEVLSEIYSYLDDYDENENSPIKLEDFLPYSVRKHYAEMVRDECGKTIEKLLNCIHTKCIEVAGCSIPLGSIGHIEWGGCGSEVVTIFLHNGERIKVADYDEREMLKQIFSYGQTTSD